MPSAPTPKRPSRRHQLKLITYDELLGNAGMSGFVSFLEPDPQPSRAAAASALEVQPRVEAVTAPATCTVQEPAAEIDRPARLAKPARIFKAALVQDGHSLAEQAVYEALWEAASPVNGPSDGDRIIRIGYDRLAKLTRLSWVTVKANLRSLEKKLAIEVTSSENSAAHQGKCYLVYSPPSILKRRKRAGLEWVRKTRGVELLARPPEAVVK